MPKIVSAVTNNDLSALGELKISEEDAEFLSKQTRIALRHCGVIDPESIEDYENTDGYKAIRKVLGSMTPKK